MYLIIGEKFKPQKYAVQLQYENAYPKGRADVDNERPDKCSSTVTAYL